LLKLTSTISTNADSAMKLYNDITVEVTPEKEASFHI